MRTVESAPVGREGDGLKGGGVDRGRAWGRKDWKCPKNDTLPPLTQKVGEPRQHLGWACFTEGQRGVVSVRKYGRMSGKGRGNKLK